jgi:hypothetical protein
VIDKVFVEIEEEKEVETEVEIEGETEECEVMIEVAAGVIKTGGEVVVVILVGVIEMISNVMMLMKMNITQKNNQIFRNRMNQQELIGDEVEVILEERVGEIIIIRKIKL